MQESMFSNESDSKRSPLASPGSFSASSEFRKRMGINSGVFKRMSTATLLDGGDSPSSYSSNSTDPQLLNLQKMPKGISQRHINALRDLF